MITWRVTDGIQCSEDCTERLAGGLATMSSAVARSCSSETRRVVSYSGRSRDLLVCVLTELEVDWLYRELILLTRSEE